MSDKTTRFFQSATSPCWPVSGLTELLSSPSQMIFNVIQWLRMKAENTLKISLNSSVLPLRGQRRLKGITNQKPIELVLSHMTSPCFPLNCGV
jgi:hypothetical protein